MATKARLHWFWRGTITVVLATGCNYLILLLVYDLARRTSAMPSTAMMVYLVVVTLPEMAIYGVLSRCFGVTPPGGELHCRRCHHILHGLSEPRCPECGEAI